MSIRERVRAALTSEREFGTERPPWPHSETGVVDALIKAGQRLDHSAQRGEPVDRAAARDVIDRLSNYVARLRPEDQAAVAHRLVAELARFPRSAA